MRTVYTTRRPRYIVQADSGQAFSNKEWHRSRIAAVLAARDLQTRNPNVRYRVIDTQG